MKGGDEPSKLAFDALFQSPEDAVPTPTPPDPTV